MRFASVSALALALVLASGAITACHHESPPARPEPGEIPPLPPASGTQVGYLIDSSGELGLREDQLEKMKEIDASLAAQNADLDVQLRQIEKPEAEERLSPQEQKAGVKPQHYNNAPGASVKTNADAAKLHQLRADNDKAALKKAWALLDATQQPAARKILEDRGVEVPGAKKKPDARDDSAGQPLPGMEP